MTNYLLFIMWAMLAAISIGQDMHSDRNLKELREIKAELVKMSVQKEKRNESICDHCL